MSESNGSEENYAPVGNFMEIEEPDRITELIEEATEEDPAEELSGGEIHDLNVSRADEVNNDWSLIVAERDIETEFRGWGTIEVPGEHTAVFANDQLMAMIGRESGTAVRIDGFEERLIRLLELEIEYLVSQRGEP